MKYYVLAAGITALSACGPGSDSKAGGQKMEMTGEVVGNKPSAIVSYLINALGKGDRDAVEALGGLHAEGCNFLWIFFLPWKNR